MLYTLIKFVDSIKLCRTDCRTRVIKLSLSQIQTWGYSRAGSTEPAASAAPRAVAEGQAEAVGLHVVGE